MNILGLFFSKKNVQAQTNDVFSHGSAKAGRRYMIRISEYALNFRYEWRMIEWDENLPEGYFARRAHSGNST
jgi:hypothetical protein